MRHILAAVLGLSAFLSLYAPAWAIELSQSGNRAILRGPIVEGDHLKFKDFMARPEAKQITVLYLHSPGGRVLPAREIARDVRNAGLATAVDASKAFCNSACTGIFAGGVRRHYLNAGSITDGGDGKNLGLGFHEGNNLQSSGSRGYSGAATSTMINTYYEMGVGAAADLATKAAYNKMYRISGQTALSLGIATSLSAP
jgi:hypothetical protein